MCLLQVLPASWGHHGPGQPLLADRRGAAPGGSPPVAPAHPAPPGRRCEPRVPPQVLKVSGDGRDRVLLALGEAFVPGSDSSHFCKPTDVALDPQSGSVFVSDGYCNARILKFSAQGKYLDEWGAGRRPGGF